jgi:hypothetical protein
MTISWPNSTQLPQKLLQAGYWEGFPNNVIIANPDVGPPMIRRRSTAAITPFKGQQILTASELANLRTFYNTTLSSGSVQFTWVHPQTQSAAEIIFLEPPTIVGVIGNKYRVQYSMGVLP